MRASLYGILLAATTCMVHAQTDPSPKFELIGSYKALGGLMATAVAPGPQKGTQRLYGSYLYADNTLDIVVINPANGKSDVFHNPVPGEYGARNIAIGPEGDVYFGTLPHAHFLRLDRKAGRLIDLGRPSPSEEYIWDVAFGTDERLYGVTYPGCRLVRYTPATQKLEDLGKMDPTEKYGRWIVAGHDGFMYIGIGTAKANIAVFNTNTGELREILPKDMQVVGIAKPYIGVDGKAYATLNDHLFALDGFQIHEFPASQKVDPYNADVLKNGDMLRLAEGGGILSIKNPNTHVERKLKISYEGENLQVFRIGFGPDGQLYGSSILPIHFLKVDIPARHIDQIGELGGGEIYSFLAHDDHLLMGAYSGLSPMLSYDPTKPVKPAEDSNPVLVNYDGSDHAWRPQAMIEGPDHRVYVGATAGYGQLEGPLLAWTGKPGSVKLYNGLVHDQSIVSLTTWKNFVVAGTTTLGGGGSHPTAESAHVFTWDTTTGEKRLDFVPVKGAKTITDLIISPAGLIYGIAVTGTTHTLFALDPQTGKTLAQNITPFHDVVYNGIGTMPDGTMVGLAEDGIFTIDPSTNAVRMVAATSMKITGGFALRGQDIYFVSNSDVYRYRVAVSHAQ